MDQVDALFLEFQAAVVGRYSLERELGRGGMGVVYLAREVRLDRLVAIKVLPPELGAHPTLRERFLREARTAARLSHPHIVPIFAVDEAAGFVFFAMAYVDGETLGERLRTRGPLRSAEATRLLREVAWALGHAHAQGVVHRDVKPANILIERESGRAMVADFGIARQASVGGATSEGERLGTPDYMSPEQASGEPLDGRSDIYSLGIVGFVSVAGHLPFSGDSAQAMLAQHITKPAPPLTSAAPAVRRGLADAIDRCLLKDPGARFQDASALAEALGEAIEKRVEIPVPVRLFLDRRRNLGSVLLSASVLLLPMTWLLPIWRNGTLLPFTHPAVLIMIGLGLSIPLLALLGRLRRLRESGFGPDDLVLALREAFRKRREEFEFEYGTRPGRLEIGLRALSLTGAAFAAAFFAIAILRAGPPQPRLIPFTLLAADVAVFSGIAALILRSARNATESAWARFWDGKVGRWLAHIAGAGVTARSVPADRPTEIAIAVSAQALYAELPKETRRALVDFPEVLRTLESQAGGLRETLRRLDAAVVEPGGRHQPALAAKRDAVVEDFRAHRDAAQDRLAAVVSALETLRLDLLRLRVGSMTLDGLTADLSAARELGREAQRLLEAKREVERAVRPVSPNPA